MTVIEVTEIEIFQFHTVFDDRRHSTDWRQMPCVWSRSRAHSRQLYQMTFTYCGKFSWGVNFVTVRTVTKITKISPPQKLPTIRHKATIIIIVCRLLFIIWWWHNTKSADSSHFEFNNTRWTLAKFTIMCIHIIYIIPHGWGQCNWSCCCRCEHKKCHISKCRYLSDSLAQWINWIQWRTGFSGLQIEEHGPWTSPP